MNTEEYYLYIIMRSDMSSMTPGRAMAQASHATSLFEKKISLSDHPLNQKFWEWFKSADGFGTTIVLNAGNNSLTDIFNVLVFKWKDQNFDPALEELDGGIVHDPDYSVKDGDFYHSVAIDTCFWMFAPRNWMKANCGLKLY